MKNRAIKLIICICVISCLMVGFCTSFASAATPVWLLRAKAGVAAAMLASQLVINPIDVVLSEPIASGIDPEGKISWVETFPEYLDRSTIKVVEDVAIIDGVPYSDVWIGPEAANTLRLKGLDFATAYNIANNQSEAITYATGYGYVEDVPIYDTGESVLRYRSPDYKFDGVGTYSIDGYTIEITSVSGGRYNYRLRSPSGNYSSFSTAINETLTLGTNNYPYLTANLFSHVPGTTAYYGHGDGASISKQAFSFDYTSGIIDAPVSEEDGLLLRVPSEYTSQSSPEYNYNIHDLINIYPTITQPGGKEINIDPDLNPDYEADVDLGNGVGDLIRTILTLLDVLDNIDVEFAPEPESPEPPPEPGQIDPLPDPDPAPDEPIAGTTIADTDWTKLDEILRWIQSTIDSIRHITESLQTMLDTLFDQIQDIIQALQELPEQLLEDIETGPSKVFRKALDVLKSLFMPLLLPIKAMMNLWHYVVEWIQSISSPFTWIFGVMSGTSYNLVLPIYAVLAGSICIAIYKALGR